MNAVPKPVRRDGNVIAMDFGGSDRVRCLRAIAAVQTALEGQAKAIADFRLTVERLRAEMAEIHLGLQRYRDRLGRVGGQVNALSDHMLDLAAIAGRARMNGAGGPARSDGTSGGS